MDEISRSFSVEQLNNVSKVLVNSKIEANEFPPISLEVAFIECCELMGSSKLENINKEVPIANNGNILNDQKTAGPNEKKNVVAKPSINNSVKIEKPITQNDEKKIMSVRF